MNYPVVYDQLCAHCGWDVGLLLLSDLLQIFQVLGLLLGDMELSHPPKVFCWAQVWKLAWTLQDLLCVAGRHNHGPSLLSSGQLAIGGGIMMIPPHA